MEIPCVVGLGSFHGDDCAGWLAVEQLELLGYPRDLLRRLRYPAEILDLSLTGLPLIVCDACQRTQPDQNRNSRVEDDRPFQQLFWPTDAIVYNRGTGTHNLQLDEVLNLGKSLHLTPESVEVWAIVGRDWSVGSEPSADIRDASQQVAHFIWSNCYA